MRNPLDLWRRRGIRSPWTGFTDMDRTFDRFMRSLWDEDLDERGMYTVAPPLDIQEEDDHYLVNVDLPGVPKDNINVQVQDNVVTVSAERKEGREEKGRRAERGERFYGRYERSFSLPTSIDLDSIQASYDNGVLELAIAKAETAKAKKVEIHSGKGSAFLGSKKQELKEAKKTEEKAS